MAELPAAGDTTDSARVRREGAPERLRVRARSIASLMATAVGAVSVALLFGSANPGTALSTPTRLTGTLAATLLLASTVSYAVAGDYVRRGRFRGRVEIDAKLPEGIAELKQGILKRRKVGAVLALAGSVLLLLAAAISLLVPTDLTAVRIRLFPDGNPAAASAGISELGELCPQLIATRIFDGRVADRDVLGSANVIPVYVDPNRCPGGRVYLARSAIASMVQLPG